MSDEQRYIVQLSDGRAFGPAHLDQIREWARQGSLPRQSVAVEEGTGMRVPVESLPGVEECMPDHGLDFFIPRNKWALISYYTSFLAILGAFCYCLPGVALGAVAVGAGVAGLRFAKVHPQAKGRLHCWWGIIVGSLTILLGLALGGIILYVMFTSP
jgi:hypothetical protein